MPNVFLLLLLMQSQPTTTLQALVNLKRPTLRLSPLTSSPEDVANPASLDEQHHHHGLEFEYDCDAPKCGIYVHVLLPKDHPDAPVTSSSTGLSKLLVFEAVVEGGFGKILKLEEGAMLELGRFEHIPAAAPNINSSSTSVNNGVPSAGETVLGDANAADPGTTSSGRHPRRRFTHFHFRKRSQGRSVSGPALAVLDAEPAPANDVKPKDGKEENMDGVRVTIRLAALDEAGTELMSPNEQTTYLHVVRFGTKSAEQDAEDSRPWVVKVVKREATIGPHTFHLHEIYGLTSSSSAVHHTPAPTAPLPVAGATYPPTEAPAVDAPDTEDEPSSECLLCLSSPREVVLLPCRHLVACKECALNMVEFGAGGSITQAEEPVATATPNAAGESGEGEGETPSTETPPTPAAPAAVTTTGPRRKRKAKGWFCPVCRQPYTSLLRITTSPPPPPEAVDKEATAQGAEGDGANAAGATPSNPAPDAPAGRLGFLRGLSFARNPAPDVESQAAMARGN
ncbi:hypothetical protein BD779DRAFT_454167 [Infundibulicybe gibba]|nr:hypothetical protein BD779DRAFT_454167 [Infundibulicybe gibba]